MITLLLINSFVCFGFWNACLYIPEKVVRNYDKSDCFNCFKVEQEEVKGVFWRIEKWSKEKWFYKPLCGCLPCMASIHSTYVYWIVNDFTWTNLAFYPVYILALSGLNYLIDLITDK